jgi:hypothetical protein
MEYGDNHFSSFVHMLAALAFVPRDDVICAFECIVDSDYQDCAEPKVTYFEDNFIGKLGRRGIRKQATFSIQLWNVHDRVSEALSRTNNSVEAWRNSF